MLFPGAAAPTPAAPSRPGTPNGLAVPLPRSVRGTCSSSASTCTWNAACGPYRAEPREAAPLDPVAALAEVPLELRPGRGPASLEREVRLISREDGRAGGDEQLWQPWSVTSSRLAERRRPASASTAAARGPHRPVSSAIRSSRRPSRPGAVLGPPFGSSSRVRPRPGCAQASQAVVATLAASPSAAHRQVAAFVAQKEVSDKRPAGPGSSKLQLGLLAERVEASGLRSWAAHEAQELILAAVRSSSTRLAREGGAPRH